MSLDPMPDTATLLRMKAEREGRSRRATFGAYPDIAHVVETANSGVRLRIPWSALISDNIKHTTDKRTGKRYCTTEYRDARKRIRQLATDAMNGRQPAECPLSLTARVWLPNNRRHDVHNYGKCIADALKGVVYTDDSWLHDYRWIRAGVDVDAPRCELTIGPLASEVAA